MLDLTVNRLWAIACLALPLTAVLAAACSNTSLSAVQAGRYTEPVLAGRIEHDEIKESSGLAASECQDILWTHNDAGNGAFIFAMDLQGRHLGVWQVEGAHSTDWESIAGYRDNSGKCFLLIGDIGDNDAVRSDLQIYRVSEPEMAPNGRMSRTSNPLRAGPLETLRFTYADGPHNAETLLVHPKTGDIYIVTKEKSGPAAVHKVRPDFGSASIVKSEKVADISVPAKPEGLLTGGSISPDGRRVMLCDKQGGYELVLPDAAGGPESIWKAKPEPVNIGDRKQGEGVSYSRDGSSLFAASEKKNALIYLIKSKL